MGRIHFRNTAMFFLKRFIAFLILYFAINISLSLLRINYISRVNLSVFTILLSLLLIFIFYIIDEFNGEVCLRITVWKKRKIWFLISMIPLFIGAYWLTRIEKCNFYGFTSFQYWESIPLEDIFFTIAIYLYLLYVPAHIIEKIFLRQAFSFDEKIIFYPIISMTILGFLGFLLPPITEAWFLKFMLPFLLSSLILLTFILKGGDYQKLSLHFNLTELVGLTLIIFFRIFIYYSSFRDSLFPKQDIIYQAAYIARINTHGLAGYLSAPLTERYPSFYFLVWSSLSRLLPLPYINMLVLASFFNHIYSTLSFLVLAKKLFKDHRKALFSTFALVILSGFSWLYILKNPPTQQLSVQELYDYIRGIHDKFGMYSGSTVSTIYADIHSLVRLWSLSVYFSSLCALLASHHNIGEKKGYLPVFSLCFIQIALGHSTELLLLGLSLFTLLLLIGKKVFKNIFKWLLVSTLFSLPFIFMFSYPQECLFALLYPMILFSLSLPLCVLLRSHIKLADKIFSRILSFVTLCLIWYYGVAIIAFINNYDSINIRYPIFTLWYSPPIQFGFLGLLFLIALLKFTYVDKRKDFGLLFNLLMLSFLGIFIALLNCMNLYLYIGLPYPLIPIYFLPFFALTSGYLLENKEMRPPNIRWNILLKLLIVIIFVFGSICHIISASYWRGNSWWTERPSSTVPSFEEVQILNLFYAMPPKQPYEEICFIPRSQPYLNVEGIAYQSIRYRATCEELLIRLSGFTPPSRLVESALFDAKSMDEIYFILNYFSPTRFILVEKGTESSITRLIENKIIFEGDKYLVIELPSLPTKGLEGLLVEKLSFSGTLLSSKGEIFENVDGELIPLNESRVLVRIKHVGNLIMHLPLNLDFKGNITLFNVRATRLYFSEALCVGQKITFHGNLSAVAMSSFSGTHLYLISLKYAGTCNIYPEPWHMNPSVAVASIHTYLRINEIPFSSTLSNPIVMLWTLFLLIIAISHSMNIKANLKKRS